MTLEWLRRHDPMLDQHLRTYLFTEGSITRSSTRAEGDRGRTTTAIPGRARSLGIGSLEGRRSRCEPPVPRARTDHRDGVGRDRGGGQADAAHLPRRPQGSSTSPARTAGRSPRSTSARVECGQVARTPTSARRCARCSRSSSCARLRTSRGPSSTRSSAAASRPTSSPCATPRSASPRPRTRRCSTASPTAGITGIARRRSTAESSIPEDYERVPALGRDGGRRACAPRASTVRTRSRSGPVATPAWSRRPRGGYPVLNHIRMILDGPDRLGARGGRRGRDVSIRGGDFELYGRAGRVDRLRLARRRAACRCTCRRASRSACTRPRPRSRCATPERA